MGPIFVRIPPGRWRESDIAAAGRLEPPVSFDGSGVRERRHRSAHPCWDHLIVAPLWPKYGVNLGTLLRTCDAVGACLAVPHKPWIRGATALLDTAVEIPMLGTGLSLNVAVASSLVAYKLAGLV